MRAIIIEVDAPYGSGALFVVEAGLKSIGVDYVVWTCDLMDILDMTTFLSNLGEAKPIFVLTSVDKMRPDFREEMMEKVRQVDATFWILRR